jgi:hypothetical protein
MLTDKVVPSTATRVTASLPADLDDDFEDLPHLADDSDSDDEDDDH